MELKSIEISNYKSIKNPIRINLTGGRPTVFTGENGSGKTNILEAIDIALSDRFYYFDRTEDITVKRVYKFTEAELNEYFDVTEEERVENTVDEIEVSFKGNEPDVKWAKVPAMKLSVEKYKTRLGEIKTDFKAYSENYLKVIEDFLKDIDYDNFLSFSTRGNEDFYRDGKGDFENHLNLAKRNFASTEEKLDNLLEQMKDGVLIFDSEHDGRIDSDLNFGDLSVPQITAYEFKANKMTAHCFGLTEEDIESANAKFKSIVDELNGRLKEEYAKVNAVLKEFNELVKKVYNLTRDLDERFWARQIKLEKRGNAFYNSLKNAMHRKCYFLDNENSMLFFNGGERYYGRSDRRERNLNSYNPITDAFDNFLKVGNHYKEGESIKEFNKLATDRKAQIVKILNDEFFKDQKLAFDKDINYKLEIVGGEPELFVIEKNGEKIGFNNTSLGRRWYLTYVFVKRLMKKGECLLIDEPAAFLHPRAQEEFRKEIDNLAKKGIIVFYTTHSPNMVSFDEDIYTVSMGESGTEVGKLDFNDGTAKGKLEGIWGSFDFYKDLVFSLSDTTVLVEGVSDKVCIEKFAELLGYDLSDYHIHVCDGEAILQGFYLLHKSGKKVLMIADNDNNFKKEYYKKQHPHYEKIMEEINGCPELCFFMGKKDGEDGCLENMFADPEKKLPIYKKYSGKNEQKIKIDPLKIEKLKELTPEYQGAKKNFKAIFKYLKIPKKAR